ncbi:MAG: diguanylate cyclase [Acetobacterium woodii]|nr:diguanylate cyclase [Acetobacterium woodii]
MIWEWDKVQTLLFAVLCICFIVYLLMGLSIYKRENQLRSNLIFFYLCIASSLWAIGYALMLISPNIEIANGWRNLSALGWCFFNGIWFAFAVSVDDTNVKHNRHKLQVVFVALSAFFFASNLLFEPAQVVGVLPIGFVDNLYPLTPIGTVFNIYDTSIILISLVIIFIKMRRSHKNRVKKQLKIILITSLITVCLGLLTDNVLPPLGLIVYPYGVVTLLIGIAGIWYAINKYKMMSISFELVSEYLFDGVSEPIFILGEDFLVKNCNKTVMQLTGCTDYELEHQSLDGIIDFRDFRFETIMETGKVINLEVDLLRKNREPLACELTATVVFDEYQDILGILILLHDVSERNKIAAIQKKNTLELEDSNAKLTIEIKERQLAEEQIRHLIYYDALTELFNRKKMLEDLEKLLDDKNEKFAILFIDLDYFKSANDRYGHEAGDYILKMVALRLRNIIHSTDTINRIGGDEFIIIHRNLKDSGDAVKTAQAVIAALEPSFNYKENQIKIGASIGISLFPEDGTDADMLINKADFAMYEVKRKGGNDFLVYLSHELY